MGGLAPAVEVERPSVESVAEELQAEVGVAEAAGAGEALLCRAPSLPRQATRVAVGMAEAGARVAMLGMNSRWAFLCF